MPADSPTFFGRTFGGKARKSCRPASPRRMINEFQTTALGCISAGARYDHFWRNADDSPSIVLQNSAGLGCVGSLCILTVSDSLSRCGVRCLLKLSRVDAAPIRGRPPLKVAGHVANCGNESISLLAACAPRLSRPDETGRARSCGA
jgi:hypothetical protein